MTYFGFNKGLYSPVCDSPVKQVEKYVPGEIIKSW